MAISVSTVAATSGSPAQRLAKPAGQKPAADRREDEARFSPEALAALNREAAQAAKASQPARG